MKAKFYVKIKAAIFCVYFLPVPVVGHTSSYSTMHQV